SNLTPDRASGIGGWSYPAFERAMRHGVARDGSYLYPAFPYTAFTRTRDEDLKALYAYLMSQPAVHSETPANQLPFPFDQRQLMAGWNLLFLEPGAYRDEPTRNQQWNRGAYLAEG
ncbi:cytochrome c, partial [Pseudomonas aeruginosa]|nr:cytochrome c [Pseudomonas aeruginosa]